MIAGSEKRHPDYPVDRLFVDRWSPRAMSGEAIAEEDLMVLFEAARWAPSSGNYQPWLILYARRDTEHWPLFLGLLVEGNRAWAGRAAALLVFVSKTTLDRDGSPNRTHSFDTGAAWENLALQGWLKRYVVHGMAGLDYERARIELEIPEDFQIEMMAAVGRPGAVEQLSERHRERESPSGRRKVTESVREGRFGQPR
jgi:nitroreductase